jgi:type II secretory pathway pseudopilin PulG
MLRSARSSQRRQSVVCHIIYVAISLVLFAIAAGLLVTNIHKFHTALAARRQALQDNKWLLKQCQSAEFYSNMRQHSSVCDEVALEEADTLWLHALRDVFDSMHPCGSISCEQRIVNALAWVFERGVFVLCAIALAFFIITMALLNTHRAFAQRQLGSPQYCDKYLYETHEFAPHSVLVSGMHHNTNGLSQRKQRIGNA